MTLRLDALELRSLEKSMNCEVQPEYARELKFNILLEHGKIDFVIDTFILFYDTYVTVKDIFSKYNTITLFNRTIDEVDKIANLLEKYRVIKNCIG